MCSCIPHIASEHVTELQQSMQQLPHTCSCIPHIASSEARREVVTRQPSRAAVAKQREFATENAF
jgi:hypothetical protein